MLQVESNSVSQVLTPIKLKKTTNKKIPLRMKVFNAILFSIFFEILNTPRTSQVNVSVPLTFL
tara:strand:+ start:58 stop:246 length:189 start_codon:yes stop_codon:yes gene_type:complete